MYVPKRVSRFKISDSVYTIEIEVTHRERKFGWAGLGYFGKNTGTAVLHNRFSGSLLDLRYKNKNKFKPSCKTA